ncbi:T9SS type A sorting domain-containing protein [Chryseobacterium scophthalmum]|uniref:Por secretion system C-terminal sorting domain-containing protein n=1 Tax=Chryseobacterium scophthalmum TaxID=59733 RepID=A0A1N6E969_9FLAO|nr:T9SS type A sorting domain-containing protein [Chryseobacterium scophthalmum]SIN79467.1 Por secretion system C-terminal sorting domain-containing protein [Chryseobacterium scophthalmum]
MRNFLLSCLLVFGIGISAQTILLEDNFDTVTTGSTGSWTGTNIGTLSVYPYNAFYVQSGCTSNLISVRTMQVTGVTSATAVNCSYQNVSATNTGFAALIYRMVDTTSYSNLKLSYKWRCGGETDQDYGQLVYSIDKINWIPVSTKLQGQTTTQTITDLALPAGAENAVIYIGWLFYANTTTATQPGLSIDDVKITGVAPTSCSGTPNTGTVSLSSYIGKSGTPITTSALAVSAGGGITYQWQSSIDNGTSWSDVSSATTPSSSITPTGNFGSSILYRLKTMCASSGQNAVSNTVTYKFDYCSVSADASANKFPVTSVKIGTLEKVSGTTPGPTTLPQEYFLQDATNFTVTQADNVTMDVKVFAGTNRMGLTFFIDWNNDGDFDDTNEAFNTTTPLTGTGTTANNFPLIPATFTVPSNAVVGNLRMRIKTNYFPTTNNTTQLATLSSACSNVINGQSEDHILTVNAQQSLAVSDIDKTGNLSVYPNPFSGILNISDIKGVKSISINDISGREVKSLVPAREINLSDLKTGLYIVNLKMNDGSIKPFKVIKK